MYRYRSHPAAGRNRRKDLRDVLMVKTETAMHHGGTLLRRAALILLLVTLTPAAPSASDEDLKWDTVADGLAFTTWNPETTCGEDIAAVIVRIDPERYRFAIHYYQDEGLLNPPLMVDWQRRIGASLMFNAGLFRDDFSYMGLLYKGGRALGKRRHPQWQALFVAEPTEGGVEQPACWTWRMTHSTRTIPRTEKPRNPLWWWIEPARSASGNRASARTKRSWPRTEPAGSPSSRRQSRRPYTGWETVFTDRFRP